MGSGPATLLTNPVTLGKSLCFSGASICSLIRWGQHYLSPRIGVSPKSVRCSQAQQGAVSRKYTCYASTCRVSASSCHCSPCPAAVRGWALRWLLPLTCWSLIVWSSQWSSIPRPPFRFLPPSTNTGGAPQSICTLSDVVYVSLFEVESNYGNCVVRRSLKRWLYSDED